MASVKMYKSDVLIIRSRTNDGDKAKQYFEIQATDVYDPAIIIKKLVLTSDFEFYQKAGYRWLRNFNGKSVFETQFGLKMTSFTKVLNWLQIESEFNFSWHPGPTPKFPPGGIISNGNGKTLVSEPSNKQPSTSN